VYDCLNAHLPDVNILIPPRKIARIWQHGNTKAERKEREENSGYLVRSFAETSMFRLKTFFGNGLSARLIEIQTTQVLIRCMALNKMTNPGMPQSYKVAWPPVSDTRIAPTFRYRHQSHALLKV
jgi:hypothetical protein